MKKSLFSKQFIIVVFCILAIGASLFAFFALQKNNMPELLSIVTPPDLKVQGPERKVLGLSVEGREIESYKFGNGKTQLVFVGGIHGGYEWNGVILAYEFMDYLKANSGFIPENWSLARFSNDPGSDPSVENTASSFYLCNQPIPGWFSQQKK